MKYFTEVIQQLVTANDQLIAGENNMTIIKAKQIAQNTQVIINGAKVMADFGRFTKTQPEFLKEKSEEFVASEIIVNKPKPEFEPEEHEIFDERAELQVKKMSVAGGGKSEPEPLFQHPSDMNYPEASGLRSPENIKEPEPEQEVKTNDYPVGHGGTGSKPPQKPFTTMYLKGCCSISETQAELLLQWLHKTKKIFTIPQLDNKCLEYYNEWVREGNNNRV